MRIGKISEKRVTKEKADLDMITKKKKKEKADGEKIRRKEDYSIQREKRERQKKL